MYDNICKFLAEAFSEDFCRWLLGQPLNLTQLSPSELSLEPIRADTLILLQSPQLLLHLEFQTSPDPQIPFRMLDYRLRAYRRFPELAMEQVVIYLKPSASELVYQQSFLIPGTSHQFKIVRLWEIEARELLEYRGLYPFAVLGKTSDPRETLRQVSQKIEEVADKTLKTNLAASSAILAGLVLERVLIQQLLQEETMKESVIYQEILAKGKAEGRAEGRAEGKAEGRAEGELSLILRLLERKFGSVAAEVIELICQLNLTELESLADALLDLHTEADLVNWLHQRPRAQ